MPTSKETLKEERSESPSEGGSPPDASPPIFTYPRWMLGVVLFLGAAAIVAGLSRPVWLLIGAPCIAVLVLYVWVRIWSARNREQP